MSKALCRHGAGCKFHEAGNCKYAHPAGADKKAVHQSTTTHKKQIAPNRIVLHRKAAPSFTVEAAIRHLTKLRLNAESAVKAAGYSTDNKGWNIGGSASKDVKQAVDPYSEYKEFAAYAKEAIRTSMGMKPLTLILPISFSFSNSVAGLVSSVLSVDVSTSAEWASMQVLYDEYRCKSGRLEFVTAAPAVVGGVGSDSLLVVGFDPSEVTPVAGTRNGCELARHKLFALPNVNGAGGTLTNGQPLTFSWSVHNEEVIGISNVAVFTSSPGLWKVLPSAGNNGSVDGYLKVYQTNSGANGAIQICGVMFLRVDFRSRT